MPDVFRELPRDTNQALGIGQYAVDFLREGSPDPAVLALTKRFHTDSVLCGLSALAAGADAPNLLRDEALTYPDPHGGTLMGVPGRVKAEKAVVANAAAAREWDSNGTNFGYRPERGWIAGEFGHNDYYSVPIAAAQEQGMGGDAALRGMVLVDEIRGRLAEVFSLKTYKIDHVVHGAIASAATYGAMSGASAEQIESAIGYFVAHHIPWRAIRAGKQLSDSKGASAAISAEAATLGMKRAMRGFRGPQDIFRNPESMFRSLHRTEAHSPFDLSLGFSGKDFAIMGMHLKLGLYEHQSAGAIQAVVEAVAGMSDRNLDQIVRVEIEIYEPAFGIIGDPAKRDPQTRQSADHSMVYIVARTLLKALRSGRTIAPEVWRDAMLLPEDYDSSALHDSATRALMERIEFRHGGPEYDAAYPDGIPTRVKIGLADGTVRDSGVVLYPLGHARHSGDGLAETLRHKWDRLAEIAGVDGSSFIVRLDGIGDMSPAELLQIYSR